MRPLKFKLSKTAVFFFFIIALIFLQVLIIAPQDLETSDPGSIERITTPQQLQALADQQTKKAVEQKMTGVHLLENANNQKGWELFAEEATGSSDDQWILKKVKVEFYAEDQSSYVVTGDVGEIDGQTKNMKIRGHVLTKSTNGYTFRTNDLEYDAAVKGLKTNDLVEMEGPPDNRGSGFQLNGTGFYIDLAKNKMSIMDRVEAHKVIDEKNFNVTSQRADFSNKSQEAQFSGDVKMNYEKTFISAPNAFFKYSNQQKALQTITMKTRVFLKEEDKTGTCDELELDLPADKMTMRGQPKVQMGTDEIQGGEIVFLEGGKKVKINKVQLKGIKQ